jgi:hypothetical protein
MLICSHSSRPDNDRRSGEQIVFRMNLGWSMNIAAVTRIAKQKIKRHICIYLLSGRVQKQLELREGNCLQCGRCCKLVFRCPMLAGDILHSRCRIYNHRSKVCMQFPVSEEDLMDVNYQCGYSFRTADNVIGNADQTKI